MADNAAEILAGLSSEQRAAIRRLRTGPKFLGPNSPDVPRGTAAALRRRRLIDSEESGSRVELTDLGRLVADEAWRRRALIHPPEDGHVRLTAVVHARRDERYAIGCLDAQLGETVTLKKDMGGSYTGRLVWYEPINDGEALSVTLDLPAAEAELAKVTSPQTPARSPSAP